MNSIRYINLLSLINDNNSHLSTIKSHYGAVNGLLYGLGGNFVSNLVPPQLNVVVATFMYAMIYHKFNLHELLFITQ